MSIITHDYSTLSDQSQLAVSQSKRQTNVPARAIQEQLLTEIDNATTEIRKQMTKKYQLEF